MFHKLVSLVKKYADLVPLLCMGLLPPIDATLAHQFANLQTVGLHSTLMLTDTTPTLAEMTGGISDLTSAWGIYIGVALIFGIAVFAVYRFMRAGR